MKKPELKLPLSPDRFPRLGFDRLLCPLPIRYRLQRPALPGDVRW
jgi:hypothetical protein